MGIFVTFGTKLTEYSTPPKGSAFTLNNGSFIARHDYGCNQEKGAMMQIILW